MMFAGRRKWFASLCLLSALPLLGLFVAPHWWRWLIILHLPPQLTLIYSCIRPNCAWFGPVVTSFQASHKEVWLTFDDGFHAENTVEILRLLNQFHARATFFVIGENIVAHPEIAAKIIQAGHTIENHSMTHPSGFFWCYFPRAAKREILDGAKAIASVTGTPPRLFRAPAGMANYFVHSALRQLHAKLIGWQARGYDTVSQDANTIVERIYTKVKPGAIILLHEQSCSVIRNESGISVLKLLLERLSREGYACITPDFTTLKCDAVILD